MTSQELLHLINQRMMGQWAEQQADKPFGFAEALKRDAARLDAVHMVKGADGVYRRA